MKIYNEVILSWNEDKQQFDTVYEDSYDYDGYIDKLAEDDEDLIDGAVKLSPPNKYPYLFNGFVFFESGAVQSATPHDLHPWVEIPDTGTDGWDEIMDGEIPGWGGFWEECFVAGTKILLPDNSYKNIEDIKIGEYVKSYNLETNQFEDKPVIKLLNDVHSGKDGDHTIIMKFSDGSQNHNTTTNPYWVKDKGWATFDEERHKELYKWDCVKIEVGDICYKNINGKLEEIELVSIEEVFDEIETFNIIVEDNHNYFATDILVHNKHAGEGGHDNDGWEGGGNPCAPGMHNLSGQHVWYWCLNHENYENYSGNTICEVIVGNDWCSYFSGMQNWAGAAACENACSGINCVWIDLGGYGDCVSADTDIEGCMDPIACNYDQNATIQSEIEYPANSGNMVPACIYANYDDGSGGPICTPATLFGTDPNQEFCDCFGNCTAASDCLDVCGGIAEITNESCSTDGFLIGDFCCDIAAGNVIDECGVCNGPGAEYQCCEIIDESGAVDNETCVPSCCPPPTRTWYYDSDGDNHYDSVKMDGSSGSAIYDFAACLPGPSGDVWISFVPEGFPPCFSDDISECWTYMSSGMEVYGCTENSACNYHYTHSEEDGSCFYEVNEYRECGGVCVDGICDGGIYVGEDCSETCTAYMCTECPGACLVDSDDDGWCDGEEIEMGTDPNDSLDPGVIAGAPGDAWEDVITTLEVISELPSPNHSVYITQIPSNGILLDSSLEAVDFPEANIVEILYNPCNKYGSSGTSQGSAELACHYQQQTPVILESSFPNGLTGDEACQTLATNSFPVVPCIGIEVKDANWAINSSPDMEYHAQWNSSYSSCESADYTQTGVYYTYFTSCDEWHTPGFQGELLNVGPPSCDTYHHCTAYEENVVNIVNNCELNWWTGHDPVNLGAGNDFWGDSMYQLFQGVRAMCDAPTEFKLTGLFSTSVQYQSNLNYNGNDTFTYKVCDDDIYDGTNSEDACTPEYSFLINVLPVNDPPVADDAVVSMYEDESININLSNYTSDVENDTLTYSITSQPSAAFGTLTLIGYMATFTPNANWSGTTSFSFNVNDGEYDSVLPSEVDSIISNSDGTLTIPNQTPATITINVFPMTDVYSEDFYEEVTEDIEKTFALSCGAEDNVVWHPTTDEYLTLSEAMNGGYGFTMEAEFLNGPSKGSMGGVVWDGSSLAATYSPDANLTGDDSVDYTCTLRFASSSWTSNQSTIEIEIFPIADGPIVLPFQLNKWNDANFAQPHLDLYGGNYWLDPLNWPEDGIEDLIAIPIIDEGQHPIQGVEGWAGLEVNNSPQGWYWVDIGPFSYENNYWWATGNQYDESLMTGMGLIGNDIYSFHVLGALHNYHTDCSTSSENPVTVTATEWNCHGNCLSDDCRQCSCTCSNGITTSDCCGQQICWDNETCEGYCDTWCGQFSYIEGETNVDPNAQYFTKELPLDLTKAPFFDPVHSNSKLTMIEGQEGYLTVRAFNPSHDLVGSNYLTSIETLEAQVTVQGGLQPEDVFVTLEGVYENNLVGSSDLNAHFAQIPYYCSVVSEEASSAGAPTFGSQDGNGTVGLFNQMCDYGKTVQTPLGINMFDLPVYDEALDHHAAMNEFILTNESVSTHYMDFCWNEEIQQYEYSPDPQNVILEFVYKVHFSPGYWNKSVDYGQASFVPTDLPVTINFDFFNNDNCSGQCKSTVSFEVSVIEVNDPVQLSGLEPSSAKFVTTGLIPEWVKQSPTNQGAGIEYSNHQYGITYTSPWMSYGENIPIEFKDPNDIGYNPISEIYVPNNVAEPFGNPNSDYSSDYFLQSFSVSDEDAENVFGSADAGGSYSCHEILEDDLPCLEIIQTPFGSNTPFPNTLPFIWNLELVGTEEAPTTPPNIVSSDLHTWDDLALADATYTRTNLGYDDIIFGNDDISPLTELGMIQTSDIIFYEEEQNRVLIEIEDAGDSWDSIRFRDTFIGGSLGANIGNIEGDQQYIIEYKILSTTAFDQDFDNRTVKIRTTTQDANGNLGNPTHPSSDEIVILNELTEYGQDLYDSDEIDKIRKEHVVTQSHIIDTTGLDLSNLSTHVSLLLGNNGADGDMKKIRIYELSIRKISDNPFLGNKYNFNLYLFPHKYLHGQLDIHRSITIDAYDGRVDNVPSYCNDPNTTPCSTNGDCDGFYRCIPSNHSEQTIMIPHAEKEYSHQYQEGCMHPLSHYSTIPNISGTNTVPTDTCGSNLDTTIDGQWLAENFIVALDESGDTPSQTTPGDFNADKTTAWVTSIDSTYGGRGYPSLISGDDTVSGWEHIIGGNTNINTHANTAGDVVVDNLTPEISYFIDGSDVDGGRVNRSLGVYLPTMHEQLSNPGNFAGQATNYDYYRQYPGFYDMDVLVDVKLYVKGRCADLDGGVIAERITLTTNNHDNLIEFDGDNNPYNNQTNQDAGYEDNINFWYNFFETGNLYKSIQDCDRACNFNHCRKSIINSFHNSGLGVNQEEPVTYSYYYFELMIELYDFYLPSSSGVTQDQCFDYFYGRYGLDYNNAQSLCSHLGFAWDPDNALPGHYDEDNLPNWVPDAFDFPYWSQIDYRTSLIDMWGIHSASWYKSLKNVGLCDAGEWACGASYLYTSDCCDSSGLQWHPTDNIPYRNDIPDSDGPPSTPWESPNPSWGVNLGLCIDYYAGNPIDPYTDCWCTNNIFLEQQPLDCTTDDEAEAYCEEFCSQFLDYQVDVIHGATGFIWSAGSPEYYTCHDHSGLKLDNEWPSEYVEEGQQDLFKFRVPLKIFNAEDTHIAINHPNDGSCAVSGECVGSSDSCSKRVFFHKIGFSLPGVVDNEVFIRPANHSQYPDVTISYRHMVDAINSNLGCLVPDGNNWETKSTRTQFFSQQICEDHGFEWVEQNNAGNFTEDFVTDPGATYDNDAADTISYFQRGGTMLFEIPRTFWYDNGFKFADYKQKVKVTNQPEYAQITKHDDEFNENTIPDWYDSGRNYTWETDGVNLRPYYYRLNNIIGPGDSEDDTDGQYVGVGGEIKSIWDNLCNPFNDILSDSFTMHLDIEPTYFGINYTTEDTSIGTNGTLDRTFNIFLVNDNDFYACNNFNIVGEEEIESIVVKQNFADIDINFDLLTQNQCGGSGVNCTPEIIHEKLINTDVISSLNYEESFEWNYSEPGYCFIQITLDDIDLAHGDLESETKILFSGDGGNTFTTLGYVGKWWTSNQEFENIMGIGAEGGGLTTVYTTGFSGGYNSNGDLTYIQVPTCQPGTNIVRVEGNGVDDAGLKHVKVTKNHNICSDGSLCGLELDTEPDEFSSTKYYWELLFDLFAYLDFGSSADAEATLEQCVEYFNGKYGMASIPASVFCVGLDMYNENGWQEGDANQGITMGTGISINSNWEHALNNAGLCTSTACCDGGDCGCCDDSGVAYTVDNPPSIVNAIPYNNINSKTFNWQDVDAPSDGGDVHQPIGYGYIKDNSVNFLAYSGNLSTCIAMGHCYVEGRNADGSYKDESLQYHLTEQGLKTYDYALNFNFTSTDTIGVGGKGETFGQSEFNPIEIAGNLEDLQDLLNRYNQNKNKFFRVVGYRKPSWDLNNQCCSQEEINNDECESNIRTLFKVISYGTCQSDGSMCIVGSDEDYYPEYTCSNNESCAGNSAMKYEVLTTDITGLDEDQPVVHVRGEIYNTPYRFCDGDRLLIDAEAGFGSEIYNTLRFDTYESLGGSETIQPHEDVNYDEIPVSYTGYEEQSNQTTITPLNLYEGGATPQIAVEVKRTFGSGRFVEGGEEVDILPVDAIMSHDLVLSVEIIGMNPPHINFVKYVGENNRQIGIQNTYLKIYDNIGNDLLSRAYLNKEDNKDPEFGVKSSGTINFSVYQPKLDSNSNPIQIPNSKIYLSGQEISLPFNGHPEINAELNITSYIWDNVLEAINNHSSEYIAYFSEDSASSPSSNIKTIIIESMKVGKEFNGVLTWSITNNAVKSQPIITDLVNGEAYPIINVYEELGGGDWTTQPYFDLLIAGSDQDKFANLNIFHGVTLVEDVEEPLFETEVVSISEYQTLTGIPNSSNFAWGNLYNDFQSNYYYYPFGSFIDYNEITDLNYYFGNAIIEYPTSDGFDSLTTSHYDLSHINSVIRFKLTEDGRNYNGNIDLNVRVVDEDGTQDRAYIRLRIHPSNDPPVIESTSDQNMYLNNEIYPNDINVQIVTSDIEENKESLSLISIDTVDVDYCDKISSVGNFIEQFNAPIQSRGKIVIPHINLVKSQIFDEYALQQLGYQSMLIDSWKNQFGPYTFPSSTVEYGIDDPSGNNEAVRVQFTNPGIGGSFIASVLDMSFEEFFKPEYFDSDPGMIGISCRNYDIIDEGLSIGETGNYSSYPAYMNYPPGGGAATDEYSWHGISEFCNSAETFTGISQGPGEFGNDQDYSTIMITNIPNRFSHPAIPNWEWNWPSSDAFIGQWHWQNYTDAFTPIMSSDGSGNPTIPNYYTVTDDGDEAIIEHPKSILRYYFHPDTNDLIPGKKYYYSGCVRSIQPGVFWSGYPGSDDGVWSAGDVYHYTLQFDIGDDNHKYISIDDTPIGEWYCFFEEFTLSNNFPIIGSDGIPKIWLDVTPGTEHLTDAIVDLYNIRMVTFDNDAGDIEHVNCTEMAYCSSICYESFGMGPKQAEEMCGFANYMSDGGVIDNSDVSECMGDIDLYANNWISQDTSIVGGRNSQCNLTKTFIDLIYDMYFYYSAQTYSDGTCTNQGATGTCDDGSSCIIGSTAEFFNGLDCESGDCVVNSDIYDVSTNCLTLYACENYLENIVGIIDIPSQFEISDPDNADEYFYFDFINPHDSASDICNKMDTDGSGTISKTNIDKLLQSTSENINRDSHFNESITLCSSGLSYGKLCERINTTIPGYCTNGSSPCVLTGEGNSTCSGNEVCRDGYCHTTCNYNVEDGICGEYDCNPIGETYSEFKYGEPRDSYCESFPIPNFLSFDNYGTQYEQFLENTGYDYLNTYVHLEPQYNSIGAKKIRIAVRDTGLNENDEFTQIRTGYSTFSIFVGEGSIEGPTGTLASIPVASFGITPDTYKYQIGGTDARQQIPTTIEREHNINVYNYHELTIPASCSDGIQTEQEECEFLGFEWIPANRVLADCGALSQVTPNDPGSENSFGECCSTIPASDSQVNNYYNSGKEHYYRQEWLDELELYSRYYSGFNSRFCNSDYTVDLNYSDYFENDNIDGFESPNQLINPLDYTKSYKFKITDVVENYDEIDWQDDPSMEWWSALGFGEYTNEEWQEIWNNLRREGWVDLFGPRVDGHPITDNYCLGYCQNYGQSSAANYNCKQYFFGPDDCRCWCTNGYYIKSDDPPFPGDCDHNYDCEDPCNEWCSQFEDDPGYPQQCTEDSDCPGEATCSVNYYGEGEHPSYVDDPSAPPVIECIVFEGEKLTQGENTVNAFQQLIGEGYVYRFEYPSIYKITVESEDTYGIPGETSIYLDARNILLLEQTIRFKFDPWQGINVIPLIHNNNALPIQNDRWFIDSQDKDKRPNLGVWFYNDLLGNKTTDWFIRHEYDYQDVEGNFTGSINLGYEFDIEEDEHEFAPDAYIFTPTTVGDSNAVLTKYYDNELQETSYKQTSAPLEARIFFYTRNVRNVDGTHSSNNIFEERDILIDNTWSSIDSGYLYVGFIDWGDGSDMDYKDEPFKLGSGKFIEHTYKKSGIYDVRGEMFMIYKCTPEEEASGDCEQEGISRGIVSFKEFIITININRDLELEGEFSNLGGEGYDFIPYGNTTPIIGGVSKYSLYYKILLNINGILNPDKIEELLEIYPPLDEITSVDIPYKFYGDKLNSEIAIVNTDENTLTETKIIPHFTGSFANQSQNINDNQEIIIDVQDNACNYGSDLNDDFDGGTGLIGVGFQCILSGSNAYNFNFMTGSYVGDESPFRSAFLDCEDECNIFVNAKDIKGFFDGVVDNSGELIPDDYGNNTITPRLINYGIDIFPGELGDYLGNTDIGQVRYFKKPFQMWQMLGFTGELPESCGTPCTIITEEDYCFSPYCIWDINQCIDNPENTEVISSDCCTDSDIGYMPCNAFLSEDSCLSPYCVWEDSQCNFPFCQTQDIYGCTVPGACNYNPSATILNFDECYFPEGICTCDGDGPIPCHEYTNQEQCELSANFVCEWFTEGWTETDDLDNYPSGYVFGPLAPENQYCGGEVTCSCAGALGLPYSFCDADCYHIDDEEIGTCVGGTNEGNDCYSMSDCPGGCINDWDNDGICDEVDLCAGAVDECGVCDGSGLNDDGCCGDKAKDLCDVCGGPGPQIQCWNNIWVCLIEDCPPEPLPGCMNPQACNYNPSADIDDGSCYYGEWYCYDSDGDGHGSAESAQLICPENAISPWVADCTDDCESLGFDHLDDMGLDNCGVCNGTNDLGCADEGGNPVLCGGKPGDYCDCDGNINDDCLVCDGPGPEYTCQDGSLVCTYEDCPEYLAECSCTGLCPGYGSAYQLHGQGMGYIFLEEDGTPYSNPINNVYNECVACPLYNTFVTSYGGNTDSTAQPLYNGGGGGWPIMVDYDQDGDGVMDSQVMDCTGMCWVDATFGPDGSFTGFETVHNRCHITSRCEVWTNFQEIATWALCNPLPAGYCDPGNFSSCLGNETSRIQCQYCGGTWNDPYLPLNSDNWVEEYMDPTENIVLQESFPGVVERVGCIENDCNRGFGEGIWPQGIDYNPASTCCYGLPPEETDDGESVEQIACTYFNLKNENWFGCENSSQCNTDEYWFPTSANAPEELELAPIPNQCVTCNTMCQEACAANVTLPDGTLLDGGEVGSANCDSSCVVDYYMGEYDSQVWGCCNCQCIYNSSASTDGGRRRRQREEREGYSTHPNNPISPRYWKNIIPINDHIYYRRGVGVLPILPDASTFDDGGNVIGRPFEVVFGWGNLYRGEIEIDSNLYDEYIEIMYSLSSGDDIGMIEFEFDGLNIPDITESSDIHFGGIILPTDQGGFNFVVSSLDGNKLILSPAPSESSAISATSVNHIFEHIDTNIDGLITMTEWGEAGGNVDEFKDYDHNYGILYEEDCLEIEGSVWYGDSGSGLYANCGDGYIDIYEAESNSKNKLLIRFPVIDRGTDILFKSIKVYDDSQSIITDFYWNNLSGNLYPYATAKYTGYNGTNIDIYSSQDYLFKNELGVNYYYPVIPKYKIDGYFDVQNENGTWENNLGLMGSPYSIPYGTPTRRWDEDDKFAPITSQLISGSLLEHNIIDLDFSTIEDDALNDLSPNTNVGILIDDYDIDYTNNPIELFPEKPTIRTKIGKKDKRKPY